MDHNTNSRECAIWMEKIWSFSVSARISKIIIAFADLWILQLVFSIFYFSYKKTTKCWKCRFRLWEKSCFILFFKRDKKYKFEKEIRYRKIWNCKPLFYDENTQSKYISHRSAKANFCWCFSSHHFVKRLKFFYIFFAYESTCWKIKANFNYIVNSNQPS